jgi:hypothetical protein
MNLKNEITINPPAIRMPNGTTKTFSPIVLKELDILIVDNAKRKNVFAQIRPVPRPLTLWTGEAYTAAGDYTQAMVEERVKELLGDDPKSVLEGLFVMPTAPPKK